MSLNYYHELWKEAQNELAEHCAYDRFVKKKGPYKDPERARWLIGHVFMGYVRIVNKLDECYDQIIHPQKREVIGRLLDCSLGRLLEVKRDLVNIEMDDYIFFDNILMELKLTPENVEIRVPQYFWRDREKSKAERRELIKQVYEQIVQEQFKEEFLKNVNEEMREEVWEQYLKAEEARKNEAMKMEELQRKRALMATEKVEVKEEKAEETPKEIVDAICIIQRHERARQARRELPLLKRKQMMRNQGVKEIRIPDEMANAAAIVIQRHWRRYRKKAMRIKRIEKQMSFLGMTIPSWRDLSCFDRVNEVLRLRRIKQERNQEEYENALETIREKMTKLYSASMNEDVTDEIRYWFEWFFLKSNFLPDFPPPDLIIPTGEILGIPKKLSKEFVEKLYPPKKKKQPDMPVPKTRLGLKLTGINPIGGSALVVAEHWIGPKEFLICQQELEKMKKSGKKEEKKKLTKEEKAALKKKQKEEEKRRLAAEAEAGFRMQDSDFLQPLTKADKDYREYWLDLDESNNYEQRYIYQLVKDEKCWELKMQVREAVDEAMRLELEILKDALERDKNPKKKKKKKPKPKAPRQKKGKKTKDLTGDRTTDELFIELFRNGIIREYEEAHLKDFIGEKSYSAFEYRRKLQDGPPSLGDVRDLILQLCILPLGSNRIHELSPVIRSVCLIGNEHSGKEFLARIICTETAAVMFDLTPENTAGKYPGKNGAKMLIHLVEKMSRVLQPSVIFIDGAEKLFYKKVPKEEKKFEPKRLGGGLKKIVKGIKPPDQVLVLGVSSFPWLCPKAKLSKTYDKYIYVPQPDYNTHYLLWQKLLMPYHSLPRDFDFSCLAKVSKGYSIKDITDLVEQIMNPGRICRNKSDPYKQSEFMEELCKIEPLQEKILAKFNKFYDSTDMRKARLKNLHEQMVAIEKSKKK